MSGDDLVYIPGIGEVDPSIVAACTADTCPIWWSFYNYYLNQGAYIAFAVCFGVAMFIYLSIWITTRKAHFFNAVMVTGCIVEVLGYAGRAWAATDQWALPSFFIQIICLTLAPAFFCAGVYVCLAYVVEIYGRDMSVLKPAIWYTIIFIPCDCLALLLQAIGGGLAASALDTYSFEDYQDGTDILTAGLVWQVFTLLCFISLCIIYAARVWMQWRKDKTALCQEAWAIEVRKTMRFKLFLPALTLSTILILWRCVYRVVELNSGFTGPVTFDQGLFIGFEGVIITIAVFLMAATHPTLCLGEAVSRKYAGAEVRSQMPKWMRPLFRGRA